MNRHWPGDVPPWERESGDRGPAAEAPDVSWPALAIVFLVAAAAWWPYPGTAYWKSDDFLAVAYASDFGRALSDFWHNQYDLQGVVWFYRPLITFSFAVDYLIGGTDPTVSHASNVLAHAVSSVLVVRLALRIAPSGLAALVAGSVWALSPAHAGSVLWAVGRVDSHTTVWALLCLLGVVRAAEHHRSGMLLAVVAFVLALGSKESAMVIPGLAAWLGFALAGSERIRNAWRVTWPLAIVLVAYLALRFAFFGRVIGGYGGATDPAAAAVGLGLSTMRWLNPLEYSGSAVCEIPPHVWWAGFLPTVLALGLALARRRFALLGVLAGFYLFACIPLTPLLPHADNLVNLRYLYLPGAALAALLVVGGPWPGLLALGVFALPFVELRMDYRDASADVVTRHARIADLADDFGAAPVFVADLPPQNDKGTVLMMHVGVDRLTQPPFVATPTRIFALRPLSMSPTSHRLPYGELTGLPLGVTLSFSGPGVLGAFPQSDLPRLEVDGPTEFDLGSRRIFELDRAGKKRESEFTLGGDWPAYRFTVFTAMGYVSTIRGAGERTFDAVFDVLWFEFDPNDPSRFAQALTGPSVFDLETEFPMLVEGGTIETTPAGPVFRAGASARRFLWLDLDRQFANLMNGEEPK